MIELAEKHSVGFFDVSSDNGNIYFPDSGKLKPIDNQENNSATIKQDDTSNQQTKKSWWKLW